MRPLRYTINLTLDGCADHQSVEPTLELHQYSARILESADALLFGRVLYEMMEQAFRVAPGQPMPNDPFTRIIHPAKKYVVSSQLTHVDWNAELVRGDLRSEVQKLKQQPGRGIYVGGVTLPKALAEWGLIDEYEFIVHPRFAGHGPYLFAGLAKPLDLKLVSSEALGLGAVSMKYVPRR